jgi:leucyl aminopeptidase
MWREQPVQINVVNGDLAVQQVDTIVVPLLERTRRPSGASTNLDQALNGMLGELLSSGQVHGRTNEITPFSTAGRIPATRVVVQGIGARNDLTPDRIRQQTATLARALRGMDAGRVAIAGQGAALATRDAETAGRILAEAFTLGLYRFDQHHTRTQDKPRGTVGDITIVEPSTRRANAVTRGARTGTILGEAQNLTRDLANAPANLMTPSNVAECAQAVAEKHGLDCKIIERAEAERLGMNSYLSVSQGSQQPPKFIVLRYTGGRGRRSIGLVGKGITFDSGGISLKPAASMERMKGDMSGAAAVIGAIGAIARLGPAVNVTAIAPCTENLPSGTATKPGDVFYAMDGQSIEVINTDAEGRLVLADALSYAKSQRCTPLIDVATLTGAMAVALGTVRTGVFSNNDRLYSQLERASEASGEKIWRFPLDNEYDEQIRSDIADIKNTGGRNAGSITAAKFLQRFAGDTPWAHLDIAGVMDAGRDRGVLVKGNAGAATRTLVHYTLGRAR